MPSCHSSWCSYSNSKPLHARLLRSGALAADPSAAAPLAAAAANSSLPYALSLLRAHPSTFSYNSTIRALARGPRPHRAIALYRYMLSSASSTARPNNYTYPPLLAACARLLAPSSHSHYHSDPDSLLSVEKERAPGSAVHASLFRRGLESPDRFITASLLSFYAAAGDLPAARQLFDLSPPSQRDLPLWNSLLHAYLSRGFYLQVLRLFRRMPAADEVTLLALVSACAHLGALDTGRWAHAYLARTHRNTVAMTITRNLGTALLNMYMRCGDVQSAWSVFHATPEKDVRTWSVMIAGLAVNGLPRGALDLFAEMKGSGVDPDSVTLTAVLSACAHAGMVDEGKAILDRMPVDYHVQPTIEHYGCAVDMLGRAGQLEEALALIRTVPLKADVALWGALLVACRVHKNVEMGQMVAMEILRLDPQHAGACVFLSNVYAAAGKWDLVQEVRSSMKEHRVYKPPGSSVVELDGVVCEFLSGDHSHPQSDRIYAMLDEIVKTLSLKGHKPATKGVTFDIDEEDKEVCISQHSEKLAVALGLINTRRGAIIRIVKCHESQTLPPPPTSTPRRPRVPPMSSPAPPPPSAAAAPSAALPATPISVQQPPPQPKPPPPAASSPPPPQSQSQPQPPPPPAPPQQRPRICFNAHCKDPKSEGPRRRGWRLRSGDYAELCDRCYGSFEQGSFCETFHSEVAGWRTCEACGKKLHCGCIVSVHAYVLLDAGGVDCILCARKSHAAMAPGQTWPSSVHMPQNVADRKDSFVKSWRPPAGQFSSQWRQTNLWSVSSIQSDLQQRLAYEFDRPSGSEKLLPGRTFIHAQEKKFDDMHDRPTTPASMNQIIRDRYANGHGQHAGLDPTYSYTLYHREGSNPNSLHDPSHHGGENDPLSSRKGVIPDPCSSVSAGFKLDSHHPSILKDDPPTLPVGLPANFASANGPKDHIRIAPVQQQSQLVSSSLQKQFYSHSVIDNEFQAQMRHGRPRMDAKARSQLLPRYWPRITDQELQHLSGDSNSVITPLFEKMLSASDAGRIGRLVLPKKCAEAYFPPISQPEGLPLKVQDASGKEWVFQFRFWPNNNSRMYVLEGVTPCIQSMQLQAGDTVTFSRIDPEGKLVMGFRKAANLSAEQEQPIKPVNGVPTPSEVNGKVPAPDSSPNAAVPRPNKVNIESKSPSPVEQTAACKMDKGGLAQKEGPGTARSSPGPVKRKATSVGPKIKRLRMDNEESMELKITWEEAQELLRPPLKAPLIVIVDGHEFEEYEEPPILGRRTYFVTDQSGENHQWAQCEDCSKWRKLPVDALLPSKWTCSDNKWDPERTSCTSAQEISVEELAELIPIKAGAAKKSKAKIETDSIEVSDGLDTLANLAILGEGESLPSQPTTRHPRHRPGCSCIVCIQPPSGKGPKHKQTCTCNVCMTVRRRFRTLMLRREKRQSVKDSEAPRRKDPGQSSESIPQTGSGPPPASTSTTSSTQKVETNADGLEDMAVEHRMTSSPIKNQIDLNIQPEREDEQSPKSDAVGAMRLLRDNPT